MYGADDVHHSPFESGRSFPRPILTWPEYFIVKLENILETFAPVVKKHVPKGFKIPLGILYALILAAIFIVLFNAGYREAINAIYLAPYGGEGDTKALCERIPASITANYMFTKDGIFEGNTDFVYAEAFGRIQLVSYVSEGDSLYEDSIESIYEGINVFGSFLSSLDLASVLLIYMTLTLSDSANSGTRVTLTASPLNVFNRKYKHTSIGNVNGTCNVESKTMYDMNTGVVTVSYPYAEFSADAMCSSIADGFNLGYDSLTTPTNLEISVDTRTVITAYAVNIGLLYLEQLIPIPGTETDYYYGEEVLTTNDYYNPSFPGMTPLSCANATVNNVARSFCVDDKE